MKKIKKVKPRAPVNQIAWAILLRGVVYDLSPIEPSWKDHGHWLRVPCVLMEIDIKKAALKKQKRSV